MGGTAADGDEAVTLVVEVNLGGVLNVLVGGVRNGAVEHGVGDLGFVKDVGDLLQDAAGHDTFIGDHQGMLATESLQTVGDFLRAVLANEGDVGNEEGSNLTHVHAFQFGTHPISPVIYYKLQISHTHILHACA